MTALVERGLAPQQPGRAAGGFTAMVVVANPFARETLSSSLLGMGAAEVVEASSLAEARVRSRATLARDLCVVDGVLPDGSGIMLMSELRSLGWARGMVLSSAEDPYTVRAALTAGVRAFLVTPSAMVRRSPSPHGGSVVAMPRRPGRVSGAEGLSAREVEVLQLVSAGRSNKDIGEALGLSALTVKSHLARIARKLGTGDRAEMVVVAMRAGVVV